MGGGCSRSGATQIIAHNDHSTSQSSSKANGESKSGQVSDKEKESKQQIEVKNERKESKSNLCSVNNIKDTQAASDSKSDCKRDSKSDTLVSNTVSSDTNHDSNRLSASDIIALIASLQEAIESRQISNLISVCQQLKVAARAPIDDTHDVKHRSSSSLSLHSDPAEVSRRLLIVLGDASFQSLSQVVKLQVAQVTNLFLQRLYLCKAKQPGSQPLLLEVCIYTNM